MIVKSLRTKTISTESSWIMHFVFWITFFNTAVILLILNCNFIESKDPLLKKLLSIGRQTDFNSDWYKMMGPTLVYTVILNALVPVGIVLSNASFWYIKRVFDDGC